MRDAPSIPLITALRDMGANVRAYDPVGMEQAKKVLPDLTYCSDEYNCAKEAAALVICTEWEQFRALDLDRLREVMASSPALVDLRNIYSPDQMANLGFAYVSIGRSHFSSADQHKVPIAPVDTPLPRRTLQGTSSP
jgi:UDPglucose 6-dehydrogenase